MGNPMSLCPLPRDYPRIKFVASFEELISTPFENGINGLCWERTLEGDFEEVIRLLGGGEGINTLEEDVLEGLPVSAAGKVAVDTMLKDLRLLQAGGHVPMVDCIHGYLRDEDPGVVPTDVYSFHADSATTEADTILCTYCGPSSEGLRNEEALRRVDVAETRATLLSLFGGDDDEGFREHLSDNCYDLHYVPVPDARPFSFGVGNLWRIAVAYPGSPVPPFIHRAPETLPGDPPRLLLIS